MARFCFDCQRHREQRAEYQRWQFVTLDGPCERCGRPYVHELRYYHDEP